MFSPDACLLLGGSDGEGKLLKVHELLDAQGKKFRGIITGLAVSESDDTVWACARARVRAETRGAS